MFEIMIEDEFASAHQLKGYEGPCERLHGHTWKVQVFLSGDRLNQLGVLYDFKQGKKILKDILSEFDHKNLNEMAHFKDSNPTAEHIAYIIYTQFNDKINRGSKIPAVKKVAVWESGSTCAIYRSDR